MDKREALAVLHHFSIPEREYLLRSINQGFINDTYLVLDHDNPLYILQRINTTVFPNVKGIMGNVGKALEYLKGEAYHAITLVHTLSGASYYTGPAHSAWRLMTYIPDSTAYDTTTDTDIAREAGRIIGTFHKLLINAPLNDFEDIIPGFHDLKLREVQFNAAMEQAPQSISRNAASAIAFVQKVLPQLKQWDQGGVPGRVCHNDTKLNNILFSMSTCKALCLIDLDTLMQGYFHYDFGDAVRTIVNTAPEDEKEHNRITFEKDLFRAFVDGLSVDGGFLTPEELALLPFGAVLMPFLHGLRALTDYLNGNLYYKVAYENQNLDRSLSLFNFTQKALDEVPYMQNVIRATFGR